MQDPCKLESGRSFQMAIYIFPQQEIVLNSMEKLHKNPKLEDDDTLEIE